MTADEFPIPPTGRPLWLITLADLALLLVGFFVLMQANTKLDPRALASGIRQGFGIAPVEKEEAIPVAAAAMLNFAPGSAMLPAAPDSLAAWAREALRDPRVSLKVTGAVDGSAADVDSVSGSGAVLAVDRARTVAAALAGITPGRMTIVNSTTSKPGRRQVIVTLAFSGDR